jgi:DNA-directed RNA polymerase specialized sigma24 family protein
MKGSDFTEMGGAGAVFLTTHWSLVEKISSDDKDHSKALIGSLLEGYWKPVYCYLRRRGYSNEDAKDLTQGFFHEVVLGHDLIEKVDQSKGRFRSYLLIALDRYVINVKQKENAQKRIPKDKLVALDVMDGSELPTTLTDLNPEESFNYAWVSTLLEAVLEQVKNQCQQDGMSLHWCLFRDRLLQPILESTNPPSLNELCERYAIEDVSKASNMIITIKRRFRTALQNHLRNLVTSDDQVVWEIEELKKYFPDIAQDLQ